MRALICLALASALGAQETRAPRVEHLAAAVDPARMEGTVAKLVSFGTRHTLSDQTSPTRGIGAAQRWLSGQFRGLVQLSGSRLQYFEDRFTQPIAPRIPAPVVITNVGAVLP
ncbi:MAG: aminopeptidase, partial [Acidobacteriota bacterium]|nr:aminopeptidase [Acidobacteriota bacterium]